MGGRLEWLSSGAAGRFARAARVRCWTARCTMSRAAPSSAGAARKREAVSFIGLLSLVAREGLRPDPRPS